MNEVRKIIQFSKFSVWSIVLLALLYSSCKDQVSTADFEKLEVKWKLIKNHLAESPYGECEFIFINNSGNTISSDDWTLDFNQITFFEESKGDTSIGKIVHINGYLHRFIPGSKFPIKAGDSIKYRYISPEPIIKAGYAPRGGYIVLQSKPIAIQEIQVSGFDQLENVFPDSNILSSVPTALSIYDHNAMIQGLLGSDQNCPIIPSPNKYEKTNLTFILTKETSINYSSEFENEAIYFQTFLDKHLNVKVNRNKNGSENDGNINLQFKKEIIGSESYELLINDKSIHIYASNNAGAFYGLQSLIQLIPAKAFQESNSSLTISGGIIKDQPRFEYRGFLLDVARNFQPKQTLLKLIDLLAHYKINKLNLRLTEDEGWRLEIAQLPELTTVGSKRGHTLDSKNHLQPAFGSGPFPSKSQDYYTKEEFVEIIQYAAQRHVEIIPEICFPSHARAAIMAMEARYDYFTKKGDIQKAEEYRLIDPEDKSKYRSAQSFKDNIASVARPSTYHFYDTVIKEIVQMYTDAGVPLKTFNTGGDEVPFGAWAESPMAKELIKTLPEINDAIQLQGYFLEKVVDMLSKYKVQISGWEEIVLNKNPNGKPIVNTKFVDKNVLPLVWDNTGTNIDLGNRIANKGYPIILCNVSNLYLDLAYDADPYEDGLYWGGFTNAFDPYLMTPLDVFKSTNYNFWGQMLDKTPIFPEAEKLNKEAIKNIKGLQAQLWSETLTKGEEMMEYFILPKLFSFAEKSWSAAPSWEQENDTQKRIFSIYKAWSSFSDIIGKYHLPKLDYWNGGYAYRVSPPGAKVIDGNIFVNTEFNNLSVRYTTDGSEPNSNSPIIVKQIPYSSKVKLRSFNQRGIGSKIFLINKLD